LLPLLQPPAPSQLILQAPDGQIGVLLDDQGSISAGHIGTSNAISSDSIVTRTLAQSVISSTTGVSPIVMTTTTSTVVPVEGPPFKNLDAIVQNIGKQHDTVAGMHSALWTFMHVQTCLVEFELKLDLSPLELKIN